MTAELHQMCLKVVEKVIDSDELMTKFRIPKHTGALFVSLENEPAFALLSPRSGMGWRG